MSTRRIRLVPLLPFALLLACSSPPQAQPTSAPADENATRAARLAQNAAIAARNADSVAAFWTDDVAVTRARQQRHGGHLRTRLPRSDRPGVYGARACRGA